MTRESEPSIPRADPAALRRHVETLAATPRLAESAHLIRMRGWAEERLRESGWPVEPDVFRAEGLRGVNLIAQAAERPEAPVFVVAAHLDTKPGTPGADDNASAVAALLETARLILPSAREGEIGLQLIVTDLEEVGMLGSAHHADRLLREGAEVAGMISLEMLGYVDSTPGSQGMPPELRGLYPDTGDFIGVVGNEASRRLMERIAAALAEVPDLKVESLAVPGMGETFPPTRLSDHSPFWDRGLPAVMITDTSFFRNPHYHMPSDTPETLDYDFLARVTDGLVRALEKKLSG